MKKATGGAQTGTIAVAVSRFGHDVVPVTVPEGATVSDVLREAGVSPATHEKLYVSGVVAESGDIVENGDVISIVTPKQAGLF